MPDLPADSELTFKWDKSRAVAKAAAAFAGRVIGADPRYISHGEIQTGLSPDGKVWASDLAGLYEKDFLDLDDDRDLLIALDGQGEIAGMVVLAWEETSRRRFAVLEDMAVDPARRSQRIGSRLLEEVERRVRERGGVQWIFLESGLGNTRAHHFFERHGFATTSHVFSKTIL
ncbi:GNAT family N-acetyltransferase [Sphingomonas sp.]|uniref:GNAT family N-acetyltransferase n=1 Tax=Sphingomonas sp. TaxID=28214 RepID=UPI002DD666E0|nr:GNAT family N-acetyltransferase [Sphingomonas sp.]